MHNRPTLPHAPQQGHLLRHPSQCEPGGNFKQRLRENRDKALAEFVRAIFAKPPGERALAQLVNGAKRMALEDSLALLDYPFERSHWRTIARAFDKPLLYVVTPQFEQQAINLKRNRPQTQIEVFKKAGAKIPTTWEEFEVAADKIQKAGFIAVAHGGQPWQDSTVFEAVALGTGGADWYKKAFVQLDQKALNSPQMEKSFATLRTVQKYIDKDAANRDWNLATAMVINGKAAMQFMGDWAKGEFLAAGKQPTKDFICVSAPGTSRSFTFNVDSFAMFRLKDPAAIQAQKALARTIMQPEFQESFNLNKGSIPVGTGVRMDRFDLCAQESAAYFAATAMINTLVPSIAHLMAQPASIEGAMREAVATYWNNDRMTTEEAMVRLVAAAKAKQAKVAKS